MNRAKTKTAWARPALMRSIHEIERLSAGHVSTQWKLSAGQKVVKSGPGRVRTCDQTVMHPTTVFAAPFGFVGWTIPSSISQWMPAI